LKTIKPLGNRLTLKAEQEEKVGSVFLPETAIQKTYRGTVLSVGEDVKKLNAGDVVYYSKFGGTPIEFEGEKIWMLCEDDILGVVEEMNELEEVIV
jgi:chaperonin GroES